MEIEIRHEPDDAAQRGRYHLLVDGADAGELDYRVADGVRTYTHTGVRDRYEGQGLAAKLVERAIADARAEGHRFTATCPYVRGYLERHPDDRDVIVDDLAEQLGLS
jgi:predicted GNAT family acetyltransferase